MERRRQGQRWQRGIRAALSAVILVVQLWGLTGCLWEREYTTEIKPIEQCVAEEYIEVDYYRKMMSGNQEYWGHVFKSDVAIGEPAQKADVYKELQYTLQEAYFTDDYRLRSVRFTVTTQSDCTMDFTIQNEYFMAESLSNAMRAGEPREIVIEVDRMCDEIFRRQSRINGGFAIGTYRFDEGQVIVPNVGMQYYRKIGDRGYTPIVTTPEVRLTIADVQLEIDCFEPPKIDP